MTFELGNKIINYLELLHSRTPLTADDFDYKIYPYIKKRDLTNWKSMTFDLEKLFLEYFNGHLEPFADDTIGYMCRLIFEEIDDYPIEKHDENIKATINYIKSRQIFSSILSSGKCNFVNQDGTNCDKDSNKAIH